MNYIQCDSYLAAAFLGKFGGVCEQLEQVLIYQLPSEKKERERMKEIKKKKKVKYTIFLNNQLS